jgi:hypothetical protein
VPIETRLYILSSLSFIRVNGQAGAKGVTAEEAKEGNDEPTAFLATTVKV